MAQSLPSEYIEELNSLNKEIREQQPTDVIQFCADYFNRKLQNRGRKSDDDDHDPLAKKETKQNTPPSHGFAGFNTNSFGSGPNEPTRSDSPSSQKRTFDDTTKLQQQHHQLQEQVHDGQSGGSGNFPVNFNANRRTSVSAESITPTQLNEAVVAQVQPTQQLSEDQLKRLNQSVAKNFLFNNLDEEALHLVLHSLQEKRVSKGDVIIKQGDEGDYFYIVEDGAVEYHVNGEKVADSGPGSSFGELALMYNAPRAATVTATKDCVLWALDRVTFRKILLHKTANKRAMYEEFLREVPVLKVLDKYELSKLADALKSETYEEGQVVVKEGDVGEEFFIIEDGSAKITKNSEGVVGDISKGDYFGEVALLNNQPRAATVTATSKLKVVALGKSAFNRLLGEVVDILKRQDPTATANQ